MKTSTSSKTVKKNAKNIFENFLNLKSKWLLGIVLTIALGFRLPLLGGSFWLDEAAQAIESSRPLFQQLDIAYDFQPPLLHLILHFATYISSAEWWLRTIGALIPGLATIGLVYVIAQKYLGKGTALIASLYLATHSFHIFYSQELRPYALPAAFATLSWWLLFQILGANRQNILKYLAFYTLATIAGLYSSYLYPFLILGQIVYIWWWSRVWIKHFLYSWLVSALVFTPWLPSFLEQLQVGQALRLALPGWEEVVSYSQFKSLGLLFGKFLFGVVDLRFSPLIIAGGIVFILLIATLLEHYFRPHRVKDVFWKVVNKFKSYIHAAPPFLPALWSWIAVPIITSWIVSIWIPVVQPKRLLFVMPAIALLLAYIITSSHRKKLAVALTIAIFAINISGTFNYWTKPALQRENWRELQTQLLTKYPSSESLAVFAFTDPFAPWNWYDRAQTATLSSGYLVNDQSKADFREELKVISKYRYILVFDYLRTLTDPDQVITNEIEKAGYKLIDITNQPGIGFVRVYALPTTTTS